jgi:hypothetical protein
MTIYSHLEIPYSQIGIESPILDMSKARILLVEDEMNRCAGAVTEKTLVKPAEWHYNRRFSPDLVELLAALFACPF